MLTSLLVALSVFSCGAAGLLPPGTHRQELVTPDGRTREYYLHVPTAYSNGTMLPLVFDVHGYTSTASAQNGYTGYRAIADAETFFVVHPEGVQRSWNAGTCCGYASNQNIDDVLFFRMMVDAIAAQVAVDRTRVFTTGMSNGGFLGHRLGLEAADVFVAIGPVAATAPYFLGRPNRAVGVYHIHGLKDLLVPYDGNLWYRGAEESCDLWRDDINGCTAERVVTDEPDSRTVCETYVDCPDGRTVTLCTHPDRHIVPSYTGPKTWAFFAAQPPLTNATVPAVAGHVRLPDAAFEFPADADEAAARYHAFLDQQ